MNWTRSCYFWSLYKDIQGFYNWLLEMRRNFCFMSTAIRWSRISSPWLWESLSTACLCHCYHQVFFHASISALFRLIITTKNVVQKLLCFFTKSTVLDSILYYFVQQVLWTLCSFGVRSFNFCRNVTTLTLGRQHHSGILKTYKFSHVYSFLNFTLVLFNCIIFVV